MGSEDHPKPAPRETSLLLRDARTGDLVARDELFARYLPKVRELVVQHLGDRLREHIDREDIVQESLLRAVRGVGQFQHQEDATFHAYLSRIVRNTIVDEARRVLTKKRGGGRVRRAGDLETETRQDFLGAMPSNVPTASGVFRASELRDRYAHALERLVPRQRQIIQLRDDRELGYPEICKLMQIANENAARGLYARAKQSLRRFMGEDAGGQ